MRPGDDVTSIVDGTTVYYARNDAGAICIVTFVMCQTLPLERSRAGPEPAAGRLGHGSLRLVKARTLRDDEPGDDVGAAASPCMTSDFQ